MVKFDVVIARAEDELKVMMLLVLANLILLPGAAWARITFYARIVMLRCRGSRNAKTRYIIIR
jgi:hypothetical protein